jgi:hypothetical protein
VLTCARKEPVEVAIGDPQQGAVIWQGRVEPDRPVYTRWTFEREEAFTLDEQIDLLLTLQIGDQPATDFPLSATVGPTEPSWPDYPAGSLHPNEVPGGDLYGRTQFIRQIVSNFTPTRSRANYLIESVRQMGKTTLLFFIKSAAPEHVLPVYIDLERMENEPQRNIWNYIIEQVQNQIGASVDHPIKDKRHADLVQLAQEICASHKKSYLLLLMDELHVLLRDEAHAKSVLTELRADLNQPGNRIAALFADRYTLRESEKKIQSEIWLQLNEIRLGPLDFSSTEAAITIPCEQRDAGFLKDTIKEIYFWTNGYPFHVQRMVQNIIEKNFSGPWVTALPEDVKEVVSTMVEQDSLFRQGLCRPERIDAEIQCAVASILEFKDLLELLPSPSEEDGWGDLAKSFHPQSSDLLISFANPSQMLGRLESIGLMRTTAQSPKQYEIFSSLLERWLRRQRDERKSLYEEGKVRAWSLSVNENVVGMTRDAWLQLDGELGAICEQSRISPPLRPKRFTGSWDLLVSTVNSRESFQWLLPGSV